MPRHKHIGLLLHKAAQDEYILDLLLPDPNAPTEAFGFHAQQAAEKLLKAVLVAVGARYPRTHRIAELLDLIQAAGVELPEHFDGLKQFTPFAVEFRHDVVPAEEESPIDKEEVHRMLRELRAWVEDMVNKRMAD